MVKLLSIYKWIILLFICFSLGVPMLFPEEISIGSYTQKTIIILVSILWSIPILLNKNSYLKKELKFTRRYLFLYLLSLAIVIIRSKLIYDYDWLDLFRNILLDYLLPIVAIPLVFVFHLEGSFESFQKRIAKLVLFMLAMRFFSWFMYHWNSSVYFPRILFQYEGWIRDGYQRIEPGMFYGVALVFISVQSLNNTVKGTIYKCCLAFMLMYLVVVTRVRFLTAISLITVLTMYSFIKTRTRGGLVLKILFLGSLALVAFLNERVVENFLQGLLFSSQYGASTNVRQLGLQHFWSIMVQEKAYFGLGFLLRNNFLALSILSRNQWSVYYLDDLGIFGAFVQFGLLTFITHIILFIKSIKVTLRCFKSANRSYLLYSLGMTVYMIGSSFLLNIFDRQRILDVSFYLAVFSFLDANTRYIDSERTRNI